MNRRNILQRPLAKWTAYHLMILVMALVLAPAFSWALQGQAFGPSFPSLFILIFLQMELFIWLGIRFFAFGPDPSAKRGTRALLLRLLVFFVLVLVIASIINLLFLFLTSISGGTDWKEILALLIQEEYRSFFLSVTAGIMLGAIAFFYFQWQDALKREQKLREEKLIFQYETLKNQVNPHFLFNNLNALSSLLHQDVDLADRFIQKLSSTYRYILENEDTELVNLAEEIKFVEDYFYLQKIRGQEKVLLDIRIASADKYEILPISLQLLVENALKHNSASRTQPLRIVISQEEGDIIIVKNKLQRKTKLEPSSRIGLKNLSARVKLTLGKDVEVRETQDEFIVKVPVKSIRS